MIVNGYKTMWLVVLFDLPVKTKRDRRRYTRFRQALKKDGFNRLQFSVYARSCPSEENTRVHLKRVKELLPPRGQVRVLTFTDKQFGRQQVFWGRKLEKTETPPNQLELF